MENSPVISFRLATEDDQHLPAYDNTKLVAINTCPTWGILRYDMHKAMSSGGRAMALEAGSTMHEVFAWVRLCQLRHQLHASEAATLSSSPSSSVDAFNIHGLRNFGKDRWEDITTQLPNWDTEDLISFTKSGAITVLETGTFYDDPRDKRRTLTNMIECSLAYVDRWRWDDLVWVRDDSDPCGDVGIEIPFDIVCSVEYEVPFIGLNKQFRITGKIDGIHVQNGRITLQENKTAARLNDAWSAPFHINSQPTHYMIAASVFTGEQVRNADILGLAIPLPKTYDYGGFIREPVSRRDYHFKRWVSWLLHTVALCEQYRGNPYDSPKYTHSCNRYFRPCSFIPFCDADDEEQIDIVKEMVTDEWSPLHKEVQE